MRILTWMLLVVCVSSTAFAQSLFQLDASSGTTTVKAGSSSLANLVGDLADNSGQFTPLYGQTFSAKLNYAGIPNAILLSQSFDSNGNQIINVKVPSTGLNQTFSAANGSLDTQIKRYLRHEGFAQLAQFQAVVDRSSAAGTVDGNPLSATTLLEDAGYQEFGLHLSPFELDGQRFASEGSNFTTRYWVDAGVLDAGGRTGQYVNFTAANEFRFNDFVGLSLTTPVRFQTIKSADIFSGGLILGVPISILPANGGPFSWQVTPAAQAAAVGSQDLVTGGLIYGGQINSSLSYNIDGFTFTLADNAGYDHGANLNISGYHFNTQVNQVLFKNGLEVSKSFGNFFVDASGSWTDFLHAAYTDGYFTPEAGIGFTFGHSHSCGFRLGYIGNFGNNYNTNGGNLLLYFSQ